MVNKMLTFCNKMRILKIIFYSQVKNFVLDETTGFAFLPNLSAVKAIVLKKIIYLITCFD